MKATNDWRMMPPLCRAFRIEEGPTLVFLSGDCQEKKETKVRIVTITVQRGAGMI
jgi:hypothetical protein